MEITFTDNTLNEIALTIGTRTPETGGALFGPDNSNLVSLFVFDKKARTTAITYTPSTELIRRIPEIEMRDGVIFKGVIHSHPRRLDRPSGPDLSAFRRTLDTNPRLRSLITPIVNLDGGSKQADAHPLNDASTMRVFQAFRSSGRRLVELDPASVRVMPVDAMALCVSEALARKMGREVATQFGHERINGHAFVRGTLQITGTGSEDQRLDLYFPTQFPLLAPLAMWSESRKQQWLQLNWQPDQFSADALAESLTEAITSVALNTSETTKDKETCHGKSEQTQPRCVA